MRSFLALLLVGFAAACAPAPGPYVFTTKTLENGDIAITMKGHPGATSEQLANYIRTEGIRACGGGYLLRNRREDAHFSQESANGPPAYHTLYLEVECVK